MSKPGKCPSCRGSGYLFDRARQIKFVCTNCEGHPTPGDTPAMYRQPIRETMRLAFTSSEKHGT